MGRGNSRGSRGSTAQQAARCVCPSAGAHDTRGEAFGRLKSGGTRKSSMGTLEAGWRSRSVHAHNCDVEVVWRIAAGATRPACVGAGFAHGGKGAPGGHGPEGSTRIFSHKTATRRRAHAASSATKGLGGAQGAGFFTGRNCARGLRNRRAACHLARLG